MASLVAPNTGLFIGLLIVGEATMGILVLAGGRRMQFGMALLMAFHVGLLFFGWWLWLYAVRCWARASCCCEPNATTRSGSPRRAKAVCAQR